MEERNDFIVSSAQLVGRIAPGVAHELNSPLTLVVTSLGCLREDLDAGTAIDDMVEMREMVSDAQEGAQRVADLIRTFRAVARPASEAITRVDVNTSLRKALDLVRRELEVAAPIKLELGEPPHASVRGGLLHAWTHLFVAAADVLDDGRVDIRTWAEAGEACVRICFPAKGWPGPLEPGLFHDAISGSDGRYTVEMETGEVTICVTLPAG